jgi:signal transduction histidine kinase
VILEVRDDGAGIPEDRLSQLLRRGPEQPFGSGLSLNLVQDVVAAHGGSVEVESSTQSDRSGTVVRLTLPVPDA